MMMNIRGLVLDDPDGTTDSKLPTLVFQSIGNSNSSSRSDEDSWQAGV